MRKLEAPIANVQQALEEPLPSEQERRLFRSIFVEGRFVEEVAADVGMPAAQAHAVAQRVARWFLLVQPLVDAHEVSTLHLQRLEHQWRETMHAWRCSRQQEEILKVSYEGAGRSSTEKSSPPASDASPDAKSRGKDAKQKFEKVTRGACGDVRYLEQARRIMAEYRLLSAELQKVAHIHQDDSHDPTLNQVAKNQARRVATVRERERAENADGALGGTARGRST